MGKKSQKATSREMKGALDFFAEAGLLKRVKRSGWWVAGIKDPESVADHCFRTAVIGYYMAFMEGVDPYKVVTMCLFNDIHEARINDLHKMGHYYIDFKQAEKKVFQDQISFLNERVKQPLKAARDEYDTQTSQESIVARDADILECLVQAREYLDMGFPEAEHFFERAPEHLHTKIAQELWRNLKSWDSSQWWQAVVKFER